MTLALLAAIAVFIFLPETAGTDLPQTIDDVEKKKINSTENVLNETRVEDSELLPLTDKIETKS